jgi:hypothetical protein
MEGSISTCNICVFIDIIVLGEKATFSDFLSAAI